MTWGGQVDRLVAVVAMLSAIAPIVRAALHSTAAGGERAVESFSWKRAAVLLAGGLGALVGVFGLFLLKVELLGAEFFRPTWLGGTLSTMGGMLAVATLLASRDGMTESAAIRHMTQAAGMAVYPAAPEVALAALGLTRLVRASLPWTLTQRRWAGFAEGACLLALCLVERDETLGGLRELSPLGT